MKLVALGKQYWAANKLRADKRRKAQIYTREETKLAPIKQVIADARK